MFWVLREIEEEPTTESTTTFWHMIPDEEDISDEQLGAETGQTPADAAAPVVPRTDRTKGWDGS